jgi:hypothetical protein
MSYEEAIKVLALKWNKEWVDRYDETQEEEENDFAIEFMASVEMDIQKARGEIAKDSM